MHRAGVSQLGTTIEITCARSGGANVAAASAGQPTAPAWQDDNSEDERFLAPDDMDDEDSDGADGGDSDGGGSDYRASGSEEADGGCSGHVASQQQPRGSNAAGPSSASAEGARPSKGAQHVDRYDTWCTTVLQYYCILYDKDSSTVQCCTQHCLCCELKGTERVVETAAVLASHKSHLHVFRVELADMYSVGSVYITQCTSRIVFLLGRTARL